MILQLIEKIRVRLTPRLPGNFIGFDKYRRFGAYHWREIETNADYRNLMNAVAHYIQPTDDVLDIGCGDGAYLGNTSSKFVSGMGIDAEEVAVALANAKFIENGISNCTAHHMTIERALAYFNSNPRQFDMVWSVDVIEHLPQPIELLELANKVVKRSGKVVIGTPLYISDKLVSPYHVKEFSQDEMRAMLSPLFQIEEELILAQTRRDRRVYASSYYLAVCKPQL